MVRLLAILLIIMVPTIVFATDIGYGQTMIAKGDVLRGHFVEERQLKGFNSPMNSEGHFVVTPGRGLIWEIEKPFATTTVITPAGLVQSVKGVGLTYLPAQKMPFLQHLYDMLGGALAGDWAPLATDFVVTRKDDGKNWEADLSPRNVDNPAMPFRSISVSGHRFVEKVIMTRTDGGIDTLTFKNQVLSQSPPTTAELAAFNSVHP